MKFKRFPYLSFHQRFFNGIKQIVHAIAGIKWGELQPNRQNLRRWAGKTRRILRRYLMWRYSWLATSVGLLVVFAVALLLISTSRIAASSATMLPDSDVTTGWTPSTGTSHYSLVDDGAANNTSDYVTVASTNTTASVTDQYTLNSPTSVASASQIVFTMYMEATTNANGGTMDTISLNLIVNGTAQTATTCTPAYNSWTSCTATYSGSWVQSDVDSMQVQIVRNIKGSGKASSQPDTVLVSDVYGTLTYVSSIQYTQSAYRWFANQDSGGLPPYPLSFARTGYSQSNGPQDITSGDFNGDGKVDMATADYYNSTVSVSLNNGNGTFATAVAYPTGSYPRSLVEADFNGDGKIDLATVNANAGTISILLGNGDGTFATHVDYPTDATSYWITSGDFNGDGKIDIATGVGSGSTISILLGNGDGTFATHVDYPTGSGPYAIVTGDFNGDGKIDLATANNGNAKASILLGNGDGTFATHVDYSVGSYPEDLVTADFNGDGKIDIAVSNNTSNSVSFLLNNGDGTFASKIDYTVGSSPYALTSADFNGDGKPDVATANNSTEDITVLMNTSLNPINVGSPLAAQDTATTAPSEGTIFRLRMDVHISGAQADANTMSLNLQYADKSGYLTCSAIPTGSFSNITDTSTGVRWADNTSAINGMAIAVNANDPVHGTDVNVDQTYQEKGATTFTNPNIISIGQDGMWDFGLVADHSLQNTDYCFRLINGGVPLTTYNVYPEITMPAATFTQASYRWYNSDPWGTTLTFVKSYGTGAAATVGSVINTSDGGYAVAGTYNGSGFLSKYNSSGQLLWTKSWGGLGAAVIQTSDGGYAVAGNANASTGSDAMIARFDSTGNLMWYKSWNASGDSSYGDALVQTSDGGFALCGDITYAPSKSVISSAIFVNKYDSNGNLSWSSDWDPGSAATSPKAIVQTADSGFIILDSASSLLTKLSSSGALVWYYEYMSTSGYLEAMTPTSDGGVVLAGEILPAGSGTVLAKVDGNGTRVWATQLASNNGGYGIATTQDGGFIVVGEQTSTSIFLAKYDSSGIAQWNKTLSGAGSAYGDAIFSVVQAPDGGYMVAAPSTGSTTDLILAKFDASGNIANCGSYCGTGSTTTSTYSLSLTTLSPTTPSFTNSSTATMSITPITPTTTVIVAATMPTGTAFAPLNTPLDLPTLTTLNLRVTVRVDGSGIAMGAQSFKLQYAIRGSAPSCSAVTTSLYNDVTTTTVIQYYDDSAHTSGEKIADQTNDPSDGARTIDPQTYQEANPFSNSQSAIYAGDDGMWQFSLTVSNASLKGKDFCIRITRASDTYPTFSALNVGDVAYAPTMSELLHGGNWFSRTTGTKQWLSL